MPSFDIVSTVEMQEVTNAVDQARREIDTRYDFKGSNAKVEIEKEQIVIHVEDKMKLGAVQDILRQKLSKRGISLKSVKFEDPKSAGGDTIRQEINVKQGISSDEGKKINKTIKEAKMKVQSQIQGDQLRVTGKKRDDLQSVMTLLKDKVSDIELQFVNFRD